MASFLVLEPAGDDAPERVRFIRDGFSWAGLIFGPFYLLASRAWIAGFSTLVISILLSVAGFYEGLSFAAGAASLALNLFIALEGREWKAAAMERRGFRLRDVIVASDIETAEEIYFSGRESVSPFSAIRATDPWPAGGIGLMDAYSKK
ncbi:DUF2628 domain-containing protein [Martelella endophytica]|uniref:DUF2628 domain-containing protein n=1 Tax=Martelella endophytica TaxID=1486262 RepID=UPI0005F1AECA|nr:DUF2628 domain-containing protein [Martelella endophytica]